METVLLIKEYPPKDADGGTSVDPSRGDVSRLGKAPTHTDGARDTASQDYDRDDASEYFDASDDQSDRTHVRSTQQKEVGRIRFLGLGSLLRNFLQMLRELVMFLARHAPL